MREIFRPDYRAHEALVREARPTAQVWRVFAGGGIVGLVVWYGSPAYWLALSYMMPPEAYARVYFDFSTLILPESMLILLYGFAVMWIGVLLAALVLHNRGPVSLTGPWRTVALQFRRTLGALLVFYCALLVLPPYGHTPPLVPGLDLGRWAVFLVPALVGIAIQTSAEEVLFRGYLQQQLAARFAHPFVWMVLPSAVFGLLHYSTETHGANAPLVALWATVFGILAADLTARAGTLGPAIAVHFAGNACAILVIAPSGQMSGLALWRYPFQTSDVEAVLQMLPADFAAMAIAWLIARIILRR